MKQAFTLLEFIIVVVILGVLTTFAVPSFFRAVERSRVGEAWSNMSRIRDAEEEIRIRTGAYVDTFAPNGADPETWQVNALLDLEIPDGNFVNYHVHVNPAWRVPPVDYTIHVERDGHDRDTCRGIGRPCYWGELVLDADGTMRTDSYDPFN